MNNKLVASCLLVHPNNNLLHTHNAPSRKANKRLIYSFHLLMARIKEEELAKMSAKAK